MRVLISTSAYQVSKKTTTQVMALMERTYKEAIERYKSIEVPQSQSPAGPDSSKFHATVGGMVEYCANITVPVGMFRRTFRHFLKLGSGIRVDNRRKVFDAVKKVLDKLSPGLPLENGRLHCPDGDVIFGEVHGTNWGGVGCYVLKRSDWGENEYQEKTK